MNDLANYQEIMLEVSSPFFEKVNQYLENYLIENLLGYYEILYDEEENNKINKIMFYFPENDKQAVEKIFAILTSLNIEKGNYKIYKNIIKPKNYWDEYKKTFQPFLVSEHFYLIPVWYKEEFRIDSERYIPLYIEPGLAFGTGYHPSTQLMLQWIDGYDFKDKIVLDAGCGSGILSIAVLKKNALKVVGFDIDSYAIEATKKNLSHNDFIQYINKKIFLHEGSWDEPVIHQNYDVILANLTLPVFIKYHGQIINIKTKIMVISGIGIEQIQEVENFYKDYFQINNILEKEGWGLMELHKI